MQIKKEIESDVNRFEISYLISNTNLYININTNETLDLLNVYEVLDNTTVNNKNINNNVINYSIVPGLYFSSIIVRISYSYEDIRYYEIHSLYIYNENNSLYVSEIENYPYIKYLDDQLDNNFITNSEYEELVNSYYRSNIPFNIEQSEEELLERSVIRTRFHGYVKWYDESGLLKVGKYNKVEIYENSISSSNLIGTIQCNSNGYYSFYYEGGICSSIIHIKVYFGSLNCNICDDSSNVYFVSSSFNNCETGYSYRSDFNIGTSSSINKAFILGQAFNYESRFIYDVLGDTLLNCSVIYPSESSNQNYEYIENNNIIKIKDVNNNYKDYDILLRYYSYLIMKKYNILGDSYFGDDFVTPISTNGNNGYIGSLRIAWKASLSILLSVLVQQKYSLNSLSFNDVGDLEYHSFDITDINIYNGERCIGTIISILYDTFELDTLSNDSYISFCEVIFNNSISSLNEFNEYVNNLDEEEDVLNLKEKFYQARFANGFDLRLMTLEQDQLSNSLIVISLVWSLNENMFPVFVSCIIRASDCPNLVINISESLYTSHSDIIINKNLLENYFYCEYIYFEFRFRFNTSNGITFYVNYNQIEVANFYFGREY